MTQILLTRRAQVIRRLCVWTVLALVAGCSPSSEHQLTQEAIKRLRKIEAGTKVGVTYVQYRQMLVDAQEAVSAMQRSARPAPGRFEVAGAMEAYADAGRLWEREVFEHPVSTCNHEFSPLIEKYQMKTSEPYGGCALVSNLMSAIKNSIWTRALSQTEEAERTLKADAGILSRVKRSLASAK